MTSMVASSSNRQRLAATAVLIAMTACWGSTFPIIHGLLDRVPVVDFLALRFTAAAVLMVAIAPRAVGSLSPAARRHAVVLGLLYGAAQLLQTYGLAHTSASVSGFVTGMYVVMTPLLAAALLRTRVSGATWTAVGLATVGLGVLSLRGVALGLGETVTLIAAAGYALHIIGLGAWSKAREALGMAIVQCIVIAVLCSAVALPGGMTLPERREDWLAVAYMAVFASAGALFAQTWAQAHLPPTRSAIIMSMEPVFAAFFAVVIGSEGVTSRMLIGGGLVLAAMLLVELRGSHPDADEAAVSVTEIESTLARGDN